MQKNMLGLKLKEYRKQKGMTQEELAELLGVSNKSVSKWELGDGYPNKKNMIKIAKTLDLSLENLMKEEQAVDNRLKESFTYALVSYCIIVAVTLLIRGIRDEPPCADLLSRDVSEIMKIVIVTFGQHIYIALVPAIIIGLVFYFYIIPQRQKD